MARKIDPHQGNILKSVSVKRMDSIVFPDEPTRQKIQRYIDRVNNSSLRGYEISEALNDMAPYKPYLQNIIREYAQKAANLIKGKTLEEIKIEFMNPRPKEIVP